MRSFTLSMLVGTLTLLLAVPALAEDGHYPTRRAERPITLTAGLLRIDAELGVSDIPFTDDLQFALEAGVAYGIVDVLTVGATVTPIILAPDAEFGDPDIFVIAEFLRTDVVHLGAEAEVIIPTDDSRDLRIAPSLIVDLHFGAAVLLRTGARFLITLADPDTKVDLIVPVDLTFSLADVFYLRAASGIFFDDMDTELFGMPLSAGVGFTIPQEDGPFIDIEAGLNFPFFLNFGDGDTVITDFWNIYAAAKIYFNP